MCINKAVAANPGLDFMITQEAMREQVVLRQPYGVELARQKGQKSKTFRKIFLTN